MRLSGELLHLLGFGSHDGGRHRMMTTTSRRFPDLIHTLNPFSWEIPDRIERKFQILEDRVSRTAETDAKAVASGRRRKVERTTRRE